jgi:hypothetical protein
MVCLRTMGGCMNTLIRTHCRILVSTTSFEPQLADSADSKFLCYYKDGSLMFIASAAALSSCGNAAASTAFQLA